MQKRRRPEKSHPVWEWEAVNKPLQLPLRLALFIVTQRRGPRRSQQNSECNLSPSITEALSQEARRRRLGRASRTKVNAMCSWWQGRENLQSGTLTTAIRLTTRRGRKEKERGATATFYEGHETCDEQIIKCGLLPRPPPPPPPTLLPQLIRDLVRHRPFVRIINKTVTLLLNLSVSRREESSSLVLFFRPSTRWLLEMLFLF